MIVLNGHTKPVGSLAFTADGRRLASYSGDNTLRLWDLDRGLEEVSLPVVCWNGRLTIDPSGRFLAWAGDCLRVWDISAGCKPVLRWRGSAWRIQFSPDGSYLAVTGFRIRRWDTRSWQKSPAWGSRHGKAHAGPLAFSRNGSLLAVAYNIGQGAGRYRSFVRLWDARTGGDRGKLAGPDQRVRALVFGRDDRSLVCLYAGTLSVWSVADGREVVQRTTGVWGSTALAITPDARFVATAGADETVRLWDTETWQERIALNWEIGKPFAVAFAPDGMRAAAAGSSGKIIIWDVDL
jgi:WD40 repeat protein